jgi:hypothetical protein
MQSSTTLVCRVGVILICLIAIPVAALLGTKLPGLICELLERGQAAASAPSEDLRAEAPPFRDPVAAKYSGEAPSAPVFGGDQAQSPLPTLLSDESSQGTDSSRPAATHYASDTAEISPAVFESEPLPLVRVAPAAWRGQSPGAEAPVARAGGVQSESAMASQPFVATPQCEELLGQLRQLGASYYALETWGAQGQYFRFQAKVAAGNGAGYVRHFDTIDPSAEEAMASVVGQVERWRASQGQLGSPSRP